MDFDKAKMQIHDLLESSGDRCEWNDVLEEHFPENFRAQDFQISPRQANICIDLPSMTFTFRDVCLGFDLPMRSYSEADTLEHGECLASGKGRMIFSEGEITEIAGLEIKLHRQYCVKPEYTPCRTCSNIGVVLASIKGAYPYPDDTILANWAKVTQGTIKRWQRPGERASSGAVDQLLISFYLQDNIANIFL